MEMDNTWDVNPPNDAAIVVFIVVRVINWAITWGWELSYIY